MIKVYSIEGDITGLTKGRMYSGKLYDAWAHANSIFKSVLESQHMHDRMFRERVMVECIVFLPFADGMGEKKKQEKMNFYHTNKPTTAMLMKAIGDMCTGILFEDASIIVSMSVEKRWSNIPRVELMVSEVQNAKRDGSEEKTPQREH